MENSKNKKNAGGGIKETLITIFSVLMYVMYSLVKKVIETVKHPSATDITKVIKGIFLIMGAIIVIVLAITLWPLTLAILATATITLLGLRCLAP